ncbi:UBAP1-MVB12-associated (UMA)-domain containing protein 1 [Heteronotia binoei]|uniref:UBAP1-MVB12-associated (UMA)-domain containing protein 1 n=1 Tax=Heteronotia binoei TaxID=13085 RepID=UPI00292EDBE9|nr:UBAP1-MVB12-associated (UMA)-domain containing protein 1 [Heteronotia binoei]
MFSFFRKSQDTKKILVSEKETDGFVLLDSTTSEERNEFKDKISYSHGLDQTSQKNSNGGSNLTEAGTAVRTEKNHNVDNNPFMSELLSDVPFTLAPHVLAAQDACSDLPQQLLSYDVNDSLTRFWYDFTLENSVLCES